jgi:hypothetical protein
MRHIGTVSEDPKPGPAITLGVRDSQGGALASWHGDGTQMSYGSAGDGRGFGRSGGPGQPRPAAPPARTGPPIRATDRDRDAAIAVLQDCFTEGRLTRAELEARVGQALAAQTYAQLDSLTADLPQRPGYPGAPAVPGPRHTNGFAVAALICGVAQPFTGMLSTIPAIAFGHVARSQIRRTGENGRSMATWGLALGWAGLAFLVLLLFGIIATVVVVSRPAVGG